MMVNLILLPLPQNKLILYSGFRSLFKRSYEPRYSQFNESLEYLVELVIIMCIQHIFVIDIDNDS